MIGQLNYVQQLNYVLPPSQNSVLNDCVSTMFNNEICSSAFTQLRFQRLLRRIPLHKHVHIHMQHGSHYSNMGSSASFGNVSTVMSIGSHYSIMCSFIFHTCAGVLQSEMEASLTLILYDEKKACAHSHVTYGSHYSNMSSFIFRAYADVLVQPEM